MVATVSIGGPGSAAEAAALPLCTGSDVRLSAHVVRGSAGAGGYSEALTATNVTDRSCHLYGHPGVQRARRTAATAYRPIGSPADWTAERPRLVRLAPGHTATAMIRQNIVDAYPQDCHRADTDALRVYLPDTATVVPVSSRSRACANMSYTTMEVGVFTAGR